MYAWDGALMGAFPSLWRYTMGKKYDAYAQAAQAETASNARWQLDPSAQNEADAKQNETIAQATFDEFLDDPEN